MTTDAAPASPVRDPEAPYGRKPDGTPYKRDPAPFAHLKGRPFASANGAAKALKASDTKPKRASVESAPAGTAEDYRKKFRRGFQAIARVSARRAPGAAVVLAVRADDMAESWGKVAVAYPKVGRLVDRFGKGSDLSEAISGTVLTAALIAHGQGLTAGTPLGDWLEDVMMDVLERFETSAEFAKLRERISTVPVETVEVNGATESETAG
jgi:hypothetical protein